MSRRDDIIAEIACAERKVAELHTELVELESRLTALRMDLAVLPAEAHIGSTTPLFTPAGHAPVSNADKVALFRSLFRGRVDVFPRRWENPKTGRSGYSPACANEWRIGLCEKKSKVPGAKRTTCGDCPNQAYLTVTEEEIAKHLKGRQVMGVYPLLQDETCWFLAADFDKKSWREDVSAFRATCEAHGLPAAVERSRSGNGAHVWFFFDSPVPAAVVRRMGCFLITDTMARRHQLSMESYDRLFPNQDTLPKGGFGNLIALPLQREARDNGNSVFVDEGFTPYADQWNFLASIRRIAPALVQSIADEAARRDQVIGVRMNEPEDEDARTPWNRPPSGRPIRLVLNEPVPPAVHAVYAQRLFIEKAGLPSPLLNQIKRLAAFQNPEFYKKQSMRLSTAFTPRVIACAEELPEHIAMPRGCLEDVEALLREYGVSLEIEDKREEGSALGFTFQGNLTPMQTEASKAVLAHDIGVFVAPPGVGKTVVGIQVIAARGRNTLVLVHRQPLLDQWIAQLALFLGIDPKEIGRIGAGKKKPNGRLDVAMLQSLVRQGEVDNLISGYGHVVVDECHHLPAFSFERVLAEVKARYITGLTATPLRRDGQQPILHMQLGPIRFTVDSRNQSARRPFEHRLVVRDTGFIPSGLPAGAGIQEFYAALAADERRNDLIFNDVVQALEEKRSPILLTERRDHLERFAAGLKSFTKHLIVLHGGMKTKERRETLARLASIPDGEERLLLATGRYIGEGFDDARLDTLFLTLPVSWKGTLVQYTGRLHRLHPGKTEVRIYDYVDRGVPMLLKMFERRLRGYRAIGYAVNEAPLGIGPTVDEFDVEYEQDELQSPLEGTNYEIE